MMRTIVLMLLAVGAASGCGHANYASHNEYGMFQEPCGNFDTAEGEAPGSVHVPEQLGAFGDACAKIQDAAANAAYVRMTNASAQHIAEASSGLAAQETIAAAIDAAVQGVSNDDIIMRTCAASAGDPHPFVAKFCREAAKILDLARQQRGGR